MSRFASRTWVILSLVALVFVATWLVAAAGSIYQAYQTAPIKLGTSGGNVNDKGGGYCCSGTLGALVAKGGAQYILSNNHVLARSDAASNGENISQPGMVDTGCSITRSAIVASLSQAARLGSNVDAAIAQVKAGMVDPSGAILTVGVPASTLATPAINMSVAKAGRTTGFTCAAIASTNTNVNVQYETACAGGTTFIVSYTNQVLINNSRFSAGGDSGSLIVNSATAQPAALLFAGSSNTTIANPIQAVAQALGVTFVGGSTHSVNCGGGKPPKKTISPAKVEHATYVKERHADDLMRDDAIMAVGVGSSDEDESEPAIVVVVEQGRAHTAIPAFLDGVRTKVILTDKIRAYGWNEPAGSCARPLM